MTVTDIFPIIQDFFVVVIGPVLLALLIFAFALSIGIGLIMFIQRRTN